MVLESETGAGGPLPGGSPGRAQGSLAASGLASGRRVLDTCSRSLHEGLFFESVERRTSCRRRPERIPSARELRVGNFGCGGPSVRALLGAMRWARPSPWPTCALSARTSRTFLPGWLTPVDRLCRIRCDSAQSREIPGSRTISRTGFGAPSRTRPPRTDLEGTPGNLEACGENPDPAFDLRKRMAKTREVDGRRLVVGWRCRSEIGTDAPSS